jgi:hypothetical protein
MVMEDSFLGGGGVKRPVLEADHLSTSSAEVFFYMAKGPAADATDAPQP